MKNLQKILFFTAIFVFIYAMCVINNVADKDLWHRIAVGEIFWHTGTILKHDIFAYTQVKQLWIDHEWGSGVVFYTLLRTFGDYGLLLLKIFSFFAVFLTIFATNRLSSENKSDFKLGFYTISTFAILSGFQSTVRSQIFTYLFFTLWIYLLEKIRKDEKSTFKEQLKLFWIFPASMLFWTNLHGGFLAGFGLLAIYAVGEFLNRKNYLKYLLIIAISLPVTLINPYGLDFWSYMFTAATMERPYITEWKPLNLFGPIYDYLAFKILLLMTITGWGYKIAAKRKKIDWTAAILLLITLYLSIKHQRHLVFFVIAASIFSYQEYYELISALFNKYFDKPWKYLSIKQQNLTTFSIKATIYMFLILFGVYMSVTNSLIIRVNDGDYPAKAVEFITKNKLKGNLLVPFNWSSYALWKLYPQCKISIDGRYEETYPDSTYMEVTDFLFHNKNWDRVLNKYHNDIILMPVDSDIYDELDSLKNWKQIYKDKYAAIFVPKAATTKNWKLPEKNIDYSKTKLDTCYRNI